MDREGHCERFNELPESTKLFIEGLNPDKIKAIEDGIESARDFKALKRFWKFVLAAIALTFGAAAGMAQVFEWIVQWGKR